MKRSPQADVPTLELWNSASVRICLSFHWCSDRYEHRLEMIEGQRRSLALTSCEGADQEFWPPSPALQQLTMQSDAQGRPCILLLGMAGKSHWSLSVVQDESGLILDAACRLQQPPGRLGSRYRIPPPWCWSRHDGLHIPSGPASVAISLEPAPEEYVLTHDADRGTLAIAPLTEITDLPATVRWRYRMQLISSAGQPLQASEHDHSV